MEAGEGFATQFSVLNALSSPFPHLLLLIQHRLLIILATLLHGGLPLCLVLRDQNEGHLVPDARDLVKIERAASPPETCPLPYLPQKTHLVMFTCVYPQKRTAHMHDVHTHTHTHNTLITTSLSLPAISTGTGQPLFFENTGSSSFLS